MDSVLDSKKCSRILFLIPKNDRIPFWILFWIPMDSVLDSIEFLKKCRIPKKVSDAKKQSVDSKLDSVRQIGIGIYNSSQNFVFDS